MAHCLGGVGDLVGIQCFGHLADQLSGGGQHVLIQRVGGTGGELRLVSGPVVGGVRVEVEEVPDIPQWQQYLTYSITDTLLGNNQVAAAQDWAGHQEPAHRVGAVTVQHLGDVRVVA